MSDRSAIPRAPTVPRGLGPAVGTRSGVVAVAAAPLQSSRWLMRFIFVEIACQLALLLPSVAGSRVIMRSTPFVASLLLVFLLPGPRENHPSRAVGVIGLGVIALSIFHPTTNTIIAGVATLGLNLAILGPIFWVPRVRIDLATVRRLFFVFWVFQTASASFGVLQIYYPGQFQPAISSVLNEDNILAGLQITLANGQRVLRPMGLTDQPGGAGIGAVYCVLFSAAFLLERPRFWFRMALIAGMLIGCFTLYLCQVRSLLVMLVISFVAMVVPFIYQRRLGRIAAVVLPVGAAAIVSFVVAVAVGGDAVTKRLATLLDGDPSTIYYSNRGTFLEHTFVNLLPEYPLGAGLGRWGMMRLYFGERFNPASPEIWSEIQWTGWLLDGGIALMVLYAIAIILAVREVMRIAVRRGFAGADELNRWAAVLVGYGISVVADTFASCPFASTFGMDFWLLNATIFAASCQLSRSESSG
jgi:hypothetical protein